MRDIVNDMFRLIRSEICGEKITPQDFNDLTEEDYENLYRLSKSQDLSHLVGHALLKNKILTQDSSVSAKFKKQYLLAISRYKNIDTELQNLKATLTEAKIPFIPLKGSVIRNYYPEPWMRTSCDIDILVHETDLDTVIDILLEKLKYQTDRVKNYHDVSLYSPSGVHLELHFSIKENMDNLDQMLEKVWEYAVPKSADSYEYILKNEFMIYHLTAHMSYHFLRGGCGIRPLIDVFLCRNAFPYDESQVLALCKTSGIETFYKAICTASDTWMKGTEKDSLTEQITAYIISGGIYGNVQNQIAVKTNKLGNKFKYVVSRIFMPYSILKIQYKNLEKHKWLLSYYEVIRWFKLFRDGRFKRSLCEVKTVKNISPESSKQTAELLEKLEL